MCSAYCHHSCTPHSAQDKVGGSDSDLSRLCLNSKADIFPNLPEALAGKAQIPKLRSFQAAITSWAFSNLDGAICFPSPQKNMHKKGANQQIYSFQGTQLGCALALGTPEFPAWWLVLQILNLLVCTIGSQFLNINQSVNQSLAVYTQMEVKRMKRKEREARLLWVQIFSRFDFEIKLLFSITRKK